MLSAILAARHYIQEHATIGNLHLSIWPGRVCRSPKKTCILRKLGGVSLKSASDCGAPRRAPPGLPVRTGKCLLATYAATTTLSFAHLDQTNSILFLSFSATDSLCYVHASCATGHRQTRGIVVGTNDLQVVARTKIARQNSLEQKPLLRQIIRSDSGEVENVSRTHAMRPPHLALAALSCSGPSVGSSLWFSALDSVLSYSRPLRNNKKSNKSNKHRYVGSVGFQKIRIILSEPEEP